MDESYKLKEKMEERLEEDGLKDSILEQIKTID